MKTIYFVRHGECQANADGVLAGSSNDSPLTDKGKQQALDAAPLVASLPLDAVVVSPLVRAQLTAQIILESAHHNVAIMTNSMFSERDFGEATGQPRERAYELLDGGQAKGVETVQELYERVSKALDFLRSIPHKHILVVSHGGFARMLGTVVTGGSPEDFLTHKALQNAELYEFTLK